ncbi:MAG: sulfur carrier protein ThiS [Phycisphaerae bacterium]
MIRITLNGKEHEVAAATTVAELLTEVRVDAPRVAVELNEQVVRRRDFDQTPLQDGDRVEIVTLVGGG